MDHILIKALIDALEASGLEELEYSRDGATLRLSKGASAPVSPPEPRAVPRAAAAVVPAAAVAASDSVVAPLYGVVHLQPAPDTPPFAAAGQAVAAGQVLCTIEAMKVFTEIRAERPGTVAAVLVVTGQEVEAGQALFRLAGV